MKCPKHFLVFMLMSLLSFSCSKNTGAPGPEGPQGEAGKKSLMKITAVGPGSNCANGGTLIQSGIDGNNNNKLDSGEIDDSIYVCNGMNGSYDKQIILTLVESPVLLAPKQELIVPLIPGFDKKNFTGVDSVVLYAQPYSNDLGSGSARVELYNVTDKEVINKSAISSSVVYSHDDFFSSENCYSFLPDKPFTLGIRLTGSYSANTGRVILMLFRK